MNERMAERIARHSTLLQRFLTPQRVYIGNRNQSPMQCYDEEVLSLNVLHTSKRVTPARRRVEVFRLCLVLHQDLRSRFRRAFKIR
jgi:hypothetical protein